MRLSPASRAQYCWLIAILGLAPQALCRRPLRGLGPEEKPLPPEESKGSDG